MTATPADGLPPAAPTSNQVLAVLQRIGRSLMLPIATMPVPVARVLASYILFVLVLIAEEMPEVVALVLRNPRAQNALMWAPEGVTHWEATRSSR